MNIRTMTPADIPLGMKLSAQNGWNQLEADWRRQLDLEPAGCFLAERDGHGIGTACGCVFGTVAWIALVLVDANQRGQGVGTALMKHVLDWLDEHGVPSVRLDATPLGRPIYEKLGFVAEFTLHRYAGVLTPPTKDFQSLKRKRRFGVPSSLTLQALTENDLAEVIALDQQVTGTDRSRLLKRLYQERPEEMRLLRGPAGLAGFIAARPGARAWQIGPCVGSLLACRQLLEDASHRHAGQPVFLDVPEDNADAAAFATALGLTVQRPLLRMGRGLTVQENRAAFWTGYGPEKG